MSEHADHSTAWLPREERKAHGKSLRQHTPRSAHAPWQAPSDRPDILDLLAESNRERLPELIPIRHARMLKSPLACFRGLASMMAHDLAQLPTTHLRLQSCGDCHLQNFGWFASPERNLVFDINDFDETRSAPWEWDVKRLAVSVALAGRELHADRDRQQELAQRVTRTYREQLTRYAALAPLEMWYERLDASSLLQQASSTAARVRMQQVIDAARLRTIAQMLPHLIDRTDGQWRIKDQPPLIFHPSHEVQYAAEIAELLKPYRESLPDDRRVLLDRYRLADVAYKVVGVGSVGLRCGMLVLLDPDESPLVLQVKEARASVLEPFVGPSRRTHHGQRIVHGQRVMQAASDVFLGWATDHAGRHYYFRQLRDMKLSVQVADLSLTELDDYSRLCGWALARAHAKAGDATTIAGYLGKSDSFDAALGSFAVAYADQVEQDFDELQRAVRAGRISSETDTELA
jgi:uncharacterized protein (DUF2252 family)